MADRNRSGAKKEVIGEASLRMGQACFPTGGISGANGHGKVDVLCEYSSCSKERFVTQPLLISRCADIVFGSQVPAGVGKQEIDIGKLKTLGDQQARLLQTALKIDGKKKGR